MSSFDEMWEEIITFIESNRYVHTLSRGNRNLIEASEPDALLVTNESTGKERTIPREDFRYAWDILTEQGELTLSHVDPELTGRKAIVLAVLAKALDLEYDKRPLKLYL